MKKQLANIITISRIVCSVCLLFCPVSSTCFCILYLFCGVTDMIDGTIARKTGAASALGATLDTAADMVFAAVCFVRILPLIQFPVWLWIWIIAVAAIKTGNIVWNLIRNRKLVSVHTIWNKATGLLLFLFPLTLGLIPSTYSGAIVCSLAMVSAINEVSHTRPGRDSF